MTDAKKITEINALIDEIGEVIEMTEWKLAYDEYAYIIRQEGEAFVLNDQWEGTDRTFDSFAQAEGACREVLQAIVEDMEIDILKRQHALDNMRSNVLQPFTAI